MSKAADYSADQKQVFIDQQRINTRLTSLQVAQDMLKVNTVGEIDAEKVVEYAAKVEAFIMQDIAFFKSKPTLVVTDKMPPAGAFKPGQ